jgi:hypothetical protein
MRDIEVQAPLAMFCSLLSLKPDLFGPMEEPKFYIFLDLYSFAVEKLVRLVTESLPSVDPRLSAVTFA